MHIKVKREKLQMEKTYCTLSLSCCRGGKALSGIYGGAPSLPAEARQGESLARGRRGVGGDCLNFLQLFHPVHLCILFPWLYFWERKLLLIVYSTNPIRSFSCSLFFTQSYA